MDDRFRRVALAIAPKGKLISVGDLAGGVSARVTAIAVEMPDGALCRYVVRRHAEARLARDPDLARREFELLAALLPSSVPVPAPRFLDVSGAIFRAPYLVMDWVEGRSDSAPADPTGSLADTLVAIHRAEVAAGSWPSRPGRNAPTLLHGDFWPGNVLWRDGRVVAVIDWEDAAFGDPLADLGSARLEVLWALGEEALVLFTARYMAAMPHLDWTDLPRWDLAAHERLAAGLAGWGLPPAREAKKRARGEAFAARALGALQP